MDPLECFPAELRAGTTLKVRREYAAYPANDGWTAAMTIFGPATLTPTVAADGAGFLYTLAAATSNAAPAGAYRYVVQVTKAGETYEAEDGQFTMLRSMTGLSGDAGLSMYERHLKMVDAMIEGKLSAGDMQSYSIAGRALARYTFDELLKLKGQLQAAVNAERNPSSAFGGEVLVEFSGTGSER